MIEAAAGAIMKRIDSLPEADRPYLIAIDGRCASGKTTLAAFLQERIQECAVVHMDHFFLQDAQRTKERRGFGNRMMFMKMHKPGPVQR